MDVTKPMDTEIENAEREAKIEDFNSCCLCGSDLKFKHHFDYSNLTVREDAHCPSCQIQLRARTHGLH